MKKVNEDILNILTSKLFPGFQEKGPGRSKLQFGVWMFLTTNTNESHDCFSLNRNLINKIKRKINEGGGDYTERVNRRIKDYACGKLNRSLLLKEYNGIPLACFAYISTTAEQHFVKLVTVPNDIIKAIKKVEKYNRNTPEEIIEARKRVINILKLQFIQKENEQLQCQYDEKFNNHHQRILSKYSFYYEQLKYWIKPFAICTNDNCNESFELLFQMKMNISINKNTIVYGISGIGKSFFSLKLLMIYIRIEIFKKYLSILIYILLRILLKVRISLTQLKKYWVGKN